MVFHDVVKPTYLAKNNGSSSPFIGLSYPEICQAYLRKERRILGYDEAKQTMRSLILAGLVSEEQDPNDRRKVLFSPVLTETAEEKNVQSHIPYSLHESPLIRGERTVQGIDYLSCKEHPDGWFTKQQWESHLSTYHQVNG